MQDSRIYSKTANQFPFMLPEITTSGPVFYPAKHPYKTYAAQNREAKRRRKAKQ